MEHQNGGGGWSSRRRDPPSANRFLRVLEIPSSSAAPIELSEHDLFSSAASQGSSPSEENEMSRSAGSASRDVRGKRGILVALNEDASVRSASGAEIRPLFNHKASPAASRSSSSSSTATAVTIPRRHPSQAERTRFHPQSAPINVPMMPAPLLKKARDLEEILSDDDDAGDGMIFPPHEMIAARNSPALSSSVLEGAGRTLKGRDLRQVRNAIWRKTGFLD